MVYHLVMRGYYEWSWSWTVGVRTYETVGNAPPSDETSFNGEDAVEVELLPPETEIKFTTPTRQDTWPSTRPSTTPNTYFVYLKEPESFQQQDYEILQGW